MNNTRKSEANTTWLFFFFYTAARLVIGTLLVASVTTTLLFYYRYTYLPYIQNPFDEFVNSHKFEEIGPFYNAIVVKDRKGHIRAVPRNETVRPLDSRTPYSWLLPNHPNEELKQYALAQPGHGPKPPPEGAEHIFFLLKTGQSVIWERLPIHFITTVTRMPVYKIYSDAAMRLGNVEIVDSLQNITNDFLKHGELQPYQVQKYLRMANSNMYVKEEAKMKNGWLLDRFKNVWMLFDAWLSDDAKRWYVFFDDDTSIMVDGLVAWLNRLDHTTPLYLGSPASYEGIEFGHGGSGVAVSHGAMKALFGGRSVEENREMLLRLTKDLLKEECGDYMVAVMLKRKIQLELAPYTVDRPWAKDKFQGETFYHSLVSQENFCSEVISFHHHGAQEISLLWELENFLSPNPVLYRDVYQHLVHPFLAQSLAAWDNRAREFEYSASLNSPTKSATAPWGSVDQCRRKCESKPECVQYRYDPYKRYCGLSTVLSLGKPVVTYPPEKQTAFWLYTQGESQLHRQMPEQEIVSGWLLDRVDKLILQQNGMGTCSNSSLVTDEDKPPRGKIEEPVGWWWDRVEEM